MAKATRLVQGFGNVGSWPRRCLKPEALDGRRGSGLYGRDHDAGGHRHPRAIAGTKAGRHGRKASPARSTISHAASSRSTADIFIPAALEGAYHRRNAGGWKCDASSPRGLTADDAEGDPILFQDGIVPAPDIVCNAGGVIVSYFEWVQDLNRDHWSETVVNAKLKEIMVKAFQETLAIARRDQVDMRTAAYLLAVQRVADATSMRGLYP